MRIRFWGTRGSIPRPGEATIRYGGNTSCVEVRTDDGTLLVLDGGTGIHELGRRLEPASRGHLLIGHTHWDHIQGFPFFAPLFDERSEWDVYAPGGRADQLRDTLSAQMSYDHHPLGMDSFLADVRFHDLREGVLECGSARITTHYMNHPVLTLGYRIEADGTVLVYSTDHEPHSILPLDAPAGAAPIHHEDQRHVEFLADADLVIHDAQYLLEEFPEKKGWGHTPVERAVDYAMAAHAGRLVLSHHDPLRDDDAVDAILEMARARAGGSGLDVSAAAEGTTLELPGGAAERGARDARPSALLTDDGPESTTVLVVEHDPDMAALLAAALEAERIQVVVARDGEAALERAEEHLPALVLLDLALPGIDGLEVCRRLRSGGDPRLHDVQILVLTGAAPDEKSMLEAFRAGATDFLTKPTKPSIVRSRVRGWLMRSPG